MLNLTYVRELKTAHSLDRCMESSRRNRLQQLHTPHPLFSSCCSASLLWKPPARSHNRKVAVTESDVIVWEHVVGSLQNNSEKNNTSVFSRFYDLTIVAHSILWAIRSVAGRNFRLLRSSLTLTLLTSVLCRCLLALQSALLVQHSAKGYQKYCWETVLIKRSLV